MGTVPQLEPDDFTFSSSLTRHHGHVLGPDTITISGHQNLGHFKAIKEFIFLSFLLSVPGKSK